MRQARYYLGRVIKIGQIDNDIIADALLSPPVVKRGRFGFTFTDMFDGRKEDTPHLFGSMVKFRPHASLDIVEPRSHESRKASIANLQEAASPFIYLPEESVVAYQHVSAKLETGQFMTVFGHLMCVTQGGFFFDCTVEPISDLTTFVRRLSEFDRITDIDATVEPPNPLFSPVWRSLKEYLKERNASQVRISEHSAGEEGLRSDLARIAQAGVDLGVTPINERRESYPIGDAAIVMAADGYGKAKIAGERRGVKKVIRTRDTQVSFDFDREPERGALLGEVVTRVKKLNHSRRLEH